MRRWLMAPIFALLLVPPGADAATATSIGLYSDPGDFIGDGRQRVFHPG